MVAMMQHYIDLLPTFPLSDRSGHVVIYNKLTPLPLIVAYKLWPQEGVTVLAFTGVNVPILPVR